MKLKLLFIGSKFIYNTLLKEYAIRSVEKKYGYIDTILFFKDSDNSVFLSIEEQLNVPSNLIIITSKKHYPTIGRVICTITEDNQILKDGSLIPSKSTLFDDSSYLLSYKDSSINILQMDEMSKMPELLIYPQKDSEVSMYVFDEDKYSASDVLLPLAQTYDIKLEFTTIVEGWIHINIKSNKYGNITNFITFAKQLLVQKIIVAEDIFAFIIERLSYHKKTISFAESCTGGLLTYYFTKHNGASNILNGSLITYSNDIKENWLGVEHKTLLEHGAVSAEVVEQMSYGAISVSEADYAISISGIAGDGGGTKEKPVGTVFVGVRSKDEHLELRLNLSGDRNYIQHQSILFAIKALLTFDRDIFFTNL
ncbi:MAG: CinA family protein [Sulfurimonas sp.]